MHKQSIQYVCSSCGYQLGKWFGKCPKCNLYSTAEEKTVILSKSSKASTLNSSGFAALTTQHTKARPIGNYQGELPDRIQTFSAELNRVLGGGLVPGSVTVFAGVPGSGKSTLLTQTASEISKTDRVLYVSAEESPEQMAYRLNRSGNFNDNFMVQSTNQLEIILEEAERIKPKMVVIDSIQAIGLSHIDSSPSSIVQVRECGSALVQFAKRTHIPVLVVGHVTKDGQMAGPKQIEHVVDMMSYLETDDSGFYRVLRSVKNRFGRAPESGIFEMTHEGFRDVVDPSMMLLAERIDGLTGTVLSAVMEGSRPVLIEAQALVSSADQASPSRNATGFDRNRMIILSEVLTKHIPANLAMRSIVCNVVGGFWVKETGVDLAFAAAMLSSYLNIPLPVNLAALGEIDLTGRVLARSQVGLKLEQLVRTGISHVIMPKAPASHIPRGMHVEIVSTVRELAEWVKKLDQQSNEPPRRQRQSR